MKRGIRALVLAMATGLVLPGVTRAEPKAETSHDFERDVQPVLQQYCNRCHGPTEQEANLRLDRLSADWTSSADAETWHDVLNRLNQGEMPPEGEPQPSEGDLAIIVDWLTEGLQQAASARRGTGREVVLRRLNRHEYSNTLRDLLGIELDYARELPPDSTSADGFQNNGATLQIAPAQLETYLETARWALRKAIVTGPAPPVHNQVFTEPKGGAGNFVPMSQGGDVAPGENFLVTLLDFPRDGEVLVRVRARSTVPAGEPDPRLQVSLGVRADTLAPARVLGETDVPAGHDDWQVFEFRGRIEEFPLPGHNPKFPGLLVFVKHLTGDDKPVVARPGNTAKKHKRDESRAEHQPLIWIESVEFVGPVYETWPPPTHTRILFPTQGNQEDLAYVSEVLERFLQRAWRRPVAPAEVERMLSFYDLVRPQSESFEGAIREVLALVLISPDFLYLVEPQIESDQPQPLDSFELASRLSYFLWSSMPDEELLELARRDALHRPAVLRRQVRRMLDDPRSWSFVEQFTDQWLNLSSVERVAVNPEFYPDFDERLKADMRDETRHFVAEILREDLSALSLIDSDFAMLNHRLAEHYGLDGPRGSSFERVALRRADRRGGLLMQGSILLGHSTGEDSHPIRRAVWVLDRLLGDPPPPPPPDVPVLDASEPDLAGLSVRRQLEVHRQKAACNNCHRGIDPWGIPLEHFDAVGQWRDAIQRVDADATSTSMSVEAEAQLPGGATVNGPEELKAYLLAHEKPRFARALASRMLAYSLGRSLEWADEATVDTLAERFTASEYRLRELIVAIVTSETFQTK